MYISCHRLLVGSSLLKSSVGSPKSTVRSPLNRSRSNQCSSPWTRRRCSSKGRHPGTPSGSCRCRPASEAEGAAGTACSGAGSMVVGDRRRTVFSRSTVSTNCYTQQRAQVPAKSQRGTKENGHGGTHLLRVLRVALGRRAAIVLGGTLLVVSLVRHCEGCEKQESMAIRWCEQSRLSEENAQEGCRFYGSACSRCAMDDAQCGVG